MQIKGIQQRLVICEAKIHVMASGEAIIVIDDDAVDGGRHHLTHPEATVAVAMKAAAVPFVRIVAGGAAAVRLVRADWTGVPGT